MYARAATAYRRVDLDSAPKSDIVVRLFRRFVEDVARARSAIEARDIEAKAAALDHALRIVVELQAALDHQAAPEMAGNLGALYAFVHDQLIFANLNLATAPLEVATRIMSELGDAFAEARTGP